jgi:steroid delta-isomerase-like uncharacterized protein
MGRLYDITLKHAEAGRSKDWDALVEFYAEDVMCWAPSYEITGRDALVEAVKAQNEPLEDIGYESTLVTETEDTVVVEWIWSIPHPSGVGRARVQGLSCFIFDGDRIQTLRQYWDGDTFMQELAADVGV